MPMKIIKNRIEEIREHVNIGLREAALKLIYGLFAEELEDRCGSKYSRKHEELATRAGSDPGSVFLSGQKVLVKKPRAKLGGKEVELESYGALQSFDLLCEKVMAHMISGVSTRNYDGLLDEVAGSTGLKKSSVSKAFKKGSKQQLEKINGRDLSRHHWVSMMIDAVHIGGYAVVVALGIDDKGKKHILGLKQGATEDWEVVRDLFRNLVDRGFKTHHALLFVIDGAKALRKGINKFFGKDQAIQRCTLHKQRNIMKYLDKKQHTEFKRRWKKLHGHVKHEEALKDHKTLVRWLGEINTEAVNSLEEANLETLTVIKLGVGNLLRKTLCSTNPIESIFDKVRDKSKRVKNWNAGVDQIPRWSATLLLAAEARFRTLKGYKGIPKLIKALKNLNLQEQLEVA
jgi:transposase-like protein